MMVIILFFAGHDKLLRTIDIHVNINAKAKKNVLTNVTIRYVVCCLSDSGSRAPVYISYCKSRKEPNCYLHLTPDIQNSVNRLLTMVTGN